MADDNALKRIIEAVFKDHFDEVTIESVTVAHDIDEDGDAILRIAVIFNGKAKQLNAERASGLLRHMRPKMAEIGEDAFPIISFIAKSDIGARNTEAA